jgi:hypothetical protein
LDLPGAGRDISMTSELFCNLASYATKRFFRSKTCMVPASDGHIVIH